MKSIQNQIKIIYKRITKSPSYFVSSCVQRLIFSASLFLYDDPTKGKPIPFWLRPSLAMLDDENVKMRVGGRERERERERRKMMDSLTVTGYAFVTHVP